jgi:uncharacterized protein YbjT (DUF2867 family)
MMKEPGLPVTMKDELVTVFGGSGFLGRHVVRALVKRGYRVRVAVRRPDLAGHLQPLGQVGQIYACQANLRYPESIAPALKDAAAAVNCVGILHETGAQKFDAVIARGMKQVAKTAAAQGIKTLVQISAIGAGLSDAHYARANFEGEKCVQEIFPQAVILRPSLIFGPEDSFFNKFASLARFMPFLPLIGGGQTLFQPVFVDDVAKAVAKAVDGKVTPGIYELGGPEILTFKQILQRILQVTLRKRLLVPLPFPLAYMQALFLQLLPNPLLTVDQVRMLKGSYAVSEKALLEGRTLQGLGIRPVPLDAVLPTYLWRFRKGGQFAENPAEISPVK